MSGGGRGRLVWSSGPDGAAPGPDRAACRRCGADPCRCEPAESAPPAEHELRVRRERAGRRGKTVTVAGPFLLTRADALALLKRLKRLCGGGGKAAASRTRAGAPCFELELQGDHVDRLVAQFAELGYRVKRAGG
jgi:translation initiation factor 1